MENNDDSIRIELFEPEIIERLCGGYLALSQHGIAIRIGATGATESEARDAFSNVLQGWLRARRAEEVSRRPDAS